MGQRQLLCIARVLLTDARILVMDEATASIDMVTDSLIQETVRTCFRDCTVLTIAHRLRTVIDYDRIMVMDAGSVVEFDVPSVLMRNPKGALTAFVAQTGPATAAYLRSVADAAYRRKRRQAGLTGKVVTPFGTFSLGSTPMVSPLMSPVGPQPPKLAELRRPEPAVSESPVGRESSPLIRVDPPTDVDTEADTEADADETSSTAVAADVVVDMPRDDSSRPAP